MRKLHLTLTIFLFLIASYFISGNYIENKLDEKLAKRLYSQIALDVSSDLQTSDTLIINAMMRIEEAESVFHEYLREDTTLIFLQDIGENIMISQRMGYNVMESINQLLKKYPEQSNRLKIKYQVFYEKDPIFLVRKSTIERYFELKSIKQELLLLNEKLKCK